MVSIVYGDAKDSISKCEYIAIEFNQFKRQKLNKLKDMDRVSGTCVTIMNDLTCVLSESWVVGPNECLKK